MSYNRYKSFTVNGTCRKVPFIEIPVSSSDFYAYYEPCKSRMDLLSYQYYDDPNYGWLILQANPSVNSMEFKIDELTKLRIPYPLNSAIQRYNDEIKKYEQLYGLE